MLTRKLADPFHPVYVVRFQTDPLPVAHSSPATGTKSYVDNPLNSPRHPHRMGVITWIPIDYPEPKPPPPPSVDLQRKLPVGVRGRTRRHASA